MVYICLYLCLQKKISLCSLENVSVSEESKVNMGENPEHVETIFFCESDQEVTQVAGEMVDSSSL